MKEAKKKVRSLSDIVQIVARAKQRGYTIVTTNGCFDLLHVGHLRVLEKGRSLGDMLIVGVNSDRSVRSYKGPGRPMMPARERALLLAALSCVDYVFVFNTKTSIPWLTKIKPHIHVKGGDRTINQIPERRTVEQCGGRVVLVKAIPGRSTTEIIKKARGIRV